VKERERERAKKGGEREVLNVIHTGEFNIDSRALVDYRELRRTRYKLPRIDESAAILLLAAVRLECAIVTNFYNARNKVCGLKIKIHFKLF